MDKHTTEKTKSSILVTGANGFVGSHLCAALLNEGYRVRGAVRNDDAVVPVGTEIANVGEISGSTNWSPTLAGMDIVVHLAARVHVMQETSMNALTEFRRINVEGVEHLARNAAAQGVRRLIFVSSIKVNGEETQGDYRYSEIDVPAPQDPYAISKWEAEQALHRVAQETGLQVVIVRPPLVYGAGVKGNFLRLLRLLSWGLPLPLALIRNRRSMLYVGNLVDALRICAVHPAASGNTYLLSDGEDISTSDLMRQLANMLGSSVRLLPIPQWLLKFAGLLTGKSTEISRLIGSLQINSEKIRLELTWHPPYTLQQGLQATADWYKALKL